jgi:hypothetical protein
MTEFIEMCNGNCEESTGTKVRPHSLLPSYVPFLLIGLTKLQCIHATRIFENIRRVVRNGNRSD